MTISENLYFQYDGVYSTDMNLLNVSVSSGLFKEPFMGQRNIKEVQIRGKDRPYFQEIQRQPFEFDLTFAFQDTWDDTTIHKIARWLSQDYYKPLLFFANISKPYFISPTMISNADSNSYKIFYALMVNSPSIVHNGLKQGYLETHWRCDSPYAYSSTQNTSLYDYSLTGSGSFDFSNDGDVVIKPNIIVNCISGGSFTLTNTTNNQSISFTGLANNEQLTLDCEKEQITSSISTQTYRYSNMSFDSVFPQMELGVNNIQVTGNVTVQINYEFKYLIY